MKQINKAFLSYACDILGDTNSGLSGSDIVKFSNKFAVKYNREIPYTSYPNKATNKRNSLIANLNCFESTEQFEILKSLCDNEKFFNNEDVKSLRIKLLSDYGYLSIDKIDDNPIVEKTNHWLSNYPNAKELFDKAKMKFDNKSLERNTLDDLRLSFELLLKDLFDNDKSLENQIPLLGKVLKEKNISNELRHMFTKFIKYYTDYQNHYVKHNDLVNSEEMEYIFEITCITMNFVISIFNTK